MGARTSRNNNVAVICNHYGWRKPLFMDPMANGYRVSLGYTAGKKEDDAKVKEIVKEITDVLNIKVTARVRRGYGYQAGNYDLIVPYTPENLTPIPFEHS